MPTFDVIPKQEAQLTTVNGRRKQTQERTNKVDMAILLQIMNWSGKVGDHLS